MVIKNIIYRIRDIGLDSSDDLHRQKLSKLLNLICFYGFFTSVLQFFLYIPYDKIAGISHLIWGAIILICLTFRAKIGFKRARDIIFLSLVAFGSLASARSGNETLGHIPSITVYIAIFIFYDLKTEWIKVTLFFIFTTTVIIIADSNVFKTMSIPIENIPFVRAMTIAITFLFISVEIILLVKLSALHENIISRKLSLKNDQLHELNREKTVLLQEVHHRVKNNLQIISSLLKLQAKEIKNEEVTFAFKQAINRINAVSQLHEQIYKSNLIADVNLKVYLETIAHTIIENNSNQAIINLTVNECTVNLENNAILPLALIFNELLTNSLKHAFDNRPTGEITIQLNQSCPAQFYFIYEDDGSWKDPSSEQTFGLELIESLVEQLDGTYERIISENGTKYTFQLSLKSETCH